VLKEICPADWKAGLYAVVDCGHLAYQWPLTAPETLVELDELTLPMKTTGHARSSSRNGAGGNMSIVNCEWAYFSFNSSG